MLTCYARFEWLFSFGKSSFQIPNDLDRVDVVVQLPLCFELVDNFVNLVL